MGNLIKETPYSEITATLEVLDKLGVERKHLHLIRVSQEQAERVAKVVRSWPPLTCKHCGSDRLELDPYGFYRNAVGTEDKSYLCQDCTDLKYKDVVRIFVDYAKPLQQMLDDCHFDGYGNPSLAIIGEENFTEKHFSINRRSSGEVKMKIFSLKDIVDKTRRVTCWNWKEIIRGMDRLGYRPAEFPEGLAYVKANPDEQCKHSIALLGSIWRNGDDYQSVAYLFGWRKKRYLSLARLGCRWSSHDRFLAICK